MILRGFVGLPEFQFSHSFSFTFGNWNTNIQLLISEFSKTKLLYGTSISSIINILLYSTLLLVPLFSQSLIGYSPSASGLLMLPRAMVCLFGLLIMGEIAKLVENRLLTAIGFIIMAAACFMLSCLNTTASMHSIIIPNLILCFGVSVAFVPISALSF